MGREFYSKPFCAGLELIRVLRGTKHEYEYGVDKGITERHTSLNALIDDCGAFGCLGCLVLCSFGSTKGIPKRAARALRFSSSGSTGSLLGDSWVSPMSERVQRGESIAYS